MPAEVSAAGLKAHGLIRQSPRHHHPTCIEIPVCSVRLTREASICGRISPNSRIPTGNEIKPIEVLRTVFVMPSHIFRIDFNHAAHLGT
jgi:hypothetical protein